MDEQQLHNIRSHFFRFLRRYSLVIALLVVALWSYSFYALGSYSVYRLHPELKAAEQASAVLQKVGKLIQLPANETPNMATINDAAIAKKDQPFLANAQDGDILIVFPNAAEAILYRPSMDKLIAVAPVSNSDPAVRTPSAVAPATSTNAAKTPKR